MAASAPMLRRLLGQETEYAIRYDPAPGEPPGNRSAYEALRAAIRTLVTCRDARPSSTDAGDRRRRFFTENGGSVYYESLSIAPDGGLLEAATPECRGPSQALLFQKAQEHLLERAIERAERTVGRGRIGLLKNCRDAFGHVYGTQENYECVVAEGAGLLFYRLGLVLFAPWVLAWALVILSVAAVVFVSVLGGLLAGMLAFAVAAVLALLLDGAAALVRGRDETRARSGALGRVGDAWRALERWAGGLDAPERPGTPAPFGRRLGYATDLWITNVVSVPVALFLRWAAFARIRRQLTAFLVSRVIFTGAGTITDPALGDRPLGDDADEEAGDRFELSERGRGARTLVRVSATPLSRGLYDSGNLIKAACSILQLRIAPYARLFRRRQRLSLGLSDANMAQPAEYLKLGTTCLVLDMVEAGFLDDAPRLVEPVGAWRTLSGDPTLTAQAYTRGPRGRRGEPMTALALQRWYLTRAREFVRRSSAPALEAHELVRLWGETLDALESDPGTLVGRVDWVTKRFLIEEAGPRSVDPRSAVDPQSIDPRSRDAASAIRKKLDLKYHELGVGYFKRLEQEDAVPKLVGAEEIEHAMRNPPEDSPARLRSRLIRQLVDSAAQVTVDWDTVRIGGRFRGKVIDLSRHRPS